MNSNFQKKPPLPPRDKTDQTPFWTPENKETLHRHTQKSSIHASGSSSPSFTEYADQNKTSALAKAFRPGVGIAGLCALLAITGVSGLVFDSYSFNSDIYETGSYSSAFLEAGEPTLFQTRDSSIVTIPVYKTDQNIYTYGTTADINWMDEEGNSMTDFVSIPDLDFFSTEPVYVSTRLNPYFDAAPDPDSLDIYLDEAFYETLENYAWMAEDEMQDQQLLRKTLLQDEQFARYQIKVTDDGVEEQNGMVVARVTLPEGRYDDDLDDDERYVSGACNILFKKDGQVVFGDVYYYPNESAQGNTFAFAYTAPYALPEYDSVEVVDLR